MPQFKTAVHVNPVSYTHLDVYKRQPLYYMLPAAVVGGFLGTLLCKKLSEKTVHTIYSITVLAIICLNLYNLVALCISL